MSSVNTLWGSNWEGRERYNKFYSLGRLIWCSFQELFKSGEYEGIFWHCSCHSHDGENVSSFNGASLIPLSK